MEQVGRDSTAYLAPQESIELTSATCYDSNIAAKSILVTLDTYKPRLLTLTLAALLDYAVSLGASRAKRPVDTSGGSDPEPARHHALATGAHEDIPSFRVVRGHRGVALAQRPIQAMAPALITR